MNYNGDEYFYITNLQGDIIELIDINGIIAATYRYDAWGNIISKFGDISDINPYRYRGYRWDEESGWYYLQSRYYNPQTGRFINSDGLLGPKGNIQGHNVYAYSFNNPVMYSDISGEFPILTILFVAAIVVYTVTMIEDLHDIATGEVYFEPSSDGGGKIVNSANIINPSVTYGYSLYLRYAGDHKDSFDGSAAGIAAEWNAHNAAYYWYTYLNKDITLADRAYDTDVGRTLFSENDIEVKVATAIQMNPVLLIYDYVQYVRARGDDYE